MKSFFYTALWSAFALVVSFSAGCRICCAPYDYCGPVYDCGQCANLTTNRCGSGVCGVPCGGQPAVAGMPAQQIPQNPAPYYHGTPSGMPTPAPGPQVQNVPNRFQNAGMPAAAPQGMPVMPPQQGMLVQQGAPAPQLMPIQPQVGKTAQPQMMMPMPPQQNTPETMIVPQQGPQEIPYYDENQKYLGSETVDASGRVIKSTLPAYMQNISQQAPQAAPTMVMPAGGVMQNPQPVYQNTPVTYNAPMTNYPQTPVQPISAGGWKTRTQPR